MTTRYHIGKNGPAPCNAHPELPNGRECRFGEDRHGTLEEVTARWESEQEAEHGGMLDGAKKAPKNSSEHSRLKAEAERLLTRRRSYDLDAESAKGGFKYAKEDIAAVLILAREQDSELSYLPLKSQDHEWTHKGFSSVEKLELEDGSIGYFKSIRKNSMSESSFQEEYESSSLAAAIAEVNAHRMGKLMGGRFSELVPETALRMHDGAPGTIQREAAEDSSVSRNFDEDEELREDYRAAAIFDFVIGNIDRHENNFIYGFETTADGEKRSRIRLIDNSLSFSKIGNFDPLNASDFAGFWPAVGEAGSRSYTVATKDLRLRSEERAALLAARRGVESWIKDRTMDGNRGENTLKRIDVLLSRGKMVNFCEWYQGEDEEEEEF